MDKDTLALVDSPSNLIKSRFMDSAGGIIATGTWRLFVLDNFVAFWEVALRATRCQTTVSANQRRRMAHAFRTKSFSSNSTDNHGPFKTTRHYPSRVGTRGISFISASALRSRGYSFGTFEIFAVTQHHTGQNSGFAFNSFRSMEP